MASFDFTSFIIGVLLGLILMLVLIWVAYFTRSFIFTYCQSSCPTCAGASYYNNPGDALANNTPLNEILFVDNGKMLYKRIPKTKECTPDHGQTVHMTYPQYCTFSGSGVSGTWKQTAFNSNIYKPIDGTIGPTITTSGDCIPAPGMPVDKGVPILRWDVNPPSD